MCEGIWLNPYLAESEGICSCLHSPHSESCSSPLSRQAQNTHSKPEQVDTIMRLRHYKNESHPANL